ncbi:MAG: DUF3781 domain-containing protein [Oscillospiraceae bacterium]|nr:DUF3781 domain-containing protein [Oscillospiraceae bacterium]
MNAELSANLDKVQTTKLGAERIRRNLGLADIDVVAWCKNRIRDADNIVRRGKNWYVHTGDDILTVNASSFTIITAQMQEIITRDMLQQQK